MWKKWKSWSELTEVQRQQAEEYLLREHEDAQAFVRARLPTSSSPSTTMPAAADPQAYQYEVGPDGNLLEHRFAQWDRRFAEWVSRQTWATKTWLWREGRGSKDWWRWWFSPQEQEVRGVLRAVARQRVAIVQFDEEGLVYVSGEIGRNHTIPTILTCYLRGWVEPAEHFAEDRLDLENGWIVRKGGQEKVTRRELFGLTFPNWYPAAWRLTDAGWSVIYRRRDVQLVGFGIAVIGLLALWP